MLKRIANASNSHQSSVVQRRRRVATLWVNYLFVYFPVYFHLHLRKQFRQSFWVRTSWSSLHIICTVREKIFVHVEYILVFLCRELENSRYQLNVKHFTLYVKWWRLLGRLFEANSGKSTYVKAESNRTSRLLQTYPSKHNNLVSYTINHRAIRNRCVITKTPSKRERKKIYIGILRFPDDVCLERWTGSGLSCQSE